MKIEIKSRFSGEVLFSHEVKDNTMKLTVEVAIKAGANLSGANLSGANLYCADLSDADLSRTDLSDANLSRTDLSGADLYCADLSGANLSGVNLSGADLSGADLYCADLSGAYLKEKENTVADVKQVGNIGSRSGYTVIFKCKKSIEINCGCFWGTLKEFEARVKMKDKKDIHRKHYEAMIEFIKAMYK